ncbi:MAG: hypothetical protein OES24_05685 [Acidimicrobiia bacterium]|nr:hypothetical protein [Acidimicrobiia bacterium]
MTVDGEQPQPGDRIEDFRLLDDRGQPWTLSEHVGSSTLLIFHRHLM